MATVLNPPSSPFVFNPVSPFTEGVLLETHNSQIIHIRTCLQTWLQGASDLRKGISGARERFSTATQALADLEVAAPYAFTPEPEYRFQRSLLSCVRCYWIALIASFSASEKDEMMHRLDCTPPFGKRVPRFKGKKCVENPGDLSAKEYEGLMRTIHLVALGMVPRDVVKTWDEIGEVGVQTWEEVD